MTESALTVIERIKSLCKKALNGAEYWMARDLMKALDYSEWRDFRDVIKRATDSCEKAGHYSSNHFALMPEMVEIGSGAMRQRENFALSKYACYLVAMNGDTSKPEIATAQAYFIEQTHLQESHALLTEEDRRAQIRDRVREANRRLSGAARNAGVRSAMFGVFHDEGYKGLYAGLGVKAIKIKKKIPEKDDLLDCIGPTELAANEFRATLAEDVLRTKGIREETKAIDTHRAVGVHVRETIKKAGGTMPENLPAAPSIKKLKKGKSIPKLPLKDE
ncbi:MAG TPA: DNA damage-inducible protein D [Acidobacteriaceae bacterium]|jgi:DNA-damage-inducible protein D|nr:DNA damage-inducible protein D [Acidobacteriaceae bacterium]